MPRKLATDALSAKATEIMLAGFRAKDTDAAIARKIAAATGERVALRTIGRRKSEFWVRQNDRDRAYEQARALMAAAKAENVNASDIIQAQLTDAMMRDTTMFDKVDPAAAQKLNLEAEKIALKREDLEVKRRLVAIDEKKLALIQDRQAKLAADTERLEAKAAQGEQLTAEEIARIRQQVYGLTA